MGDLIALVAVLGIFATVWYGIWALLVASRRRGAEETELNVEELQRQRQELVDTILQYDARVEQLEQRVASLERASFAARQESEAQVRQR